VGGEGKEGRREGVRLGGRGRERREGERGRVGSKRKSGFIVGL
jgi:hypothetical protein